MTSTPAGPHPPAPPERAGPPSGLPVYRVLTGPDDAEFCHRVSDALLLGYELHGSPALTHDGERVIVAQALRWPTGSGGDLEP